MVVGFAERAAPGDRAFACADVDASSAAANEIDANANEFKKKAIKARPRKSISLTTT
ncbi:MAG: hypothetical protein AB7F41_08570 [Methylocystis sp.]|uniref:hypothetical protein n=1 Tax=Methylocystis sp. TaxID=1911079 RepID=UPI003D0E74DD